MSTQTGVVILLPADISLAFIILLFTSRLKPLSAVIDYGFEYRLRILFGRFYLIAIYYFLFCCFHSICNHNPTISDLILCFFLMIRRKHICRCAVIVPTPPFEHRKLQLLNVKLHYQLLTANRPLYPHHSSYLWKTLYSFKSPLMAGESWYERELNGLCARHVSYHSLFLNKSD